MPYFNELWEDGNAGPMLKNADESDFAVTNYHYSYAYVMRSKRISR